MIDLRQTFVLPAAIKLINFIFLSDEEKKTVYEWRTHPDIKKWMRTDGPISYNGHLEFIERLKTDKENFYWLVKNENRYIGVVYLNKIDLSEKSAYLGIYASPHLKGAGSLLMAGLKELSFGLCGLDILRLEVMELNIKAINFYEKSGFTRQGKVCGEILKEGKRYSIIRMQIMNKE